MRHLNHHSPKSKTVNVRNLLVSADNTTGISLIRLLEESSLDLSFSAASAELQRKRIRNQIARRIEGDKVVVDRLLTASAAEAFLTSLEARTEAQAISAARQALSDAIVNGVGSLKESLPKSMTKPKTSSVPISGTRPDFPSFEAKSKTRTNRSIDGNGDARLQLEWEIAQRLLDNGALSKEEGNQMLRELYARVSGVTVEERLASLFSAETDTEELDAETMEAMTDAGFLSDDEETDDVTMTNIVKQRFADLGVSDNEEDADPVEVESAAVVVSSGNGVVQQPVLGSASIPDTMPDGYTTKPLSNYFGRPTGIAVYEGDAFVGRVASDKEALRMAWNHHDQSNDPPGFQFEQVSKTVPSRFGVPHRTREIHFTMPGQSKRSATSLQTARSAAWGTYRESQRTQNNQTSSGRLVSASELADELGDDIYPQTVGEAVQAVSRNLGIDIRKDDRYTAPYYDTDGDRSSKRNWKRYRLRPAGRDLVVAYLRNQGRLS